MAKNNQVIKLLKFYQEKEKMLVPELYSSFALALKDSGISVEDIEYLLGMTQAFWQEAVEKNVNLVKWAEEETGLNFSEFDTGKAKISK